MLRKVKVSKIGVMERVMDSELQRESRLKLRILKQWFKNSVESGVDRASARNSLNLFMKFGIHSRSSLLVSLPLPLHTFSYLSLPYI